MPEIHITSAVAFARFERVAALAVEIARDGLAEVPRMDPATGRIVLLIERSSTSEVLDAIDAIRALPGVLAVHLVYQHAEEASALEESP
jgi:nitrate reductase NapD